MCIVLVFVPVILLVFLIEDLPRLLRRLRAWVHRKLHPWNL